MKSRSDKLKSAFVGLALALCAWMPAGSETLAQGDGELSAQEKRGRQIYLKGESDGGEIKAILGSGDLELSAAAFPCANCHGLRGEGSSEGGLQPPPISRAKLFSAGQSALTRKDRGPYNDMTLARAISSGVNPDGGRLHPGMPRYKMTREQMAYLIAYLKRVGDAIDTDPGLSEDVIKVGAALPMTGQLAMIGEDVKKALGAYFTQVNGEGGVYGRKFELVVADSRGDAAGTAEATRRLIEQDKVFALVGSFEPVDSEAANEYLKRREVPLVGPVTLSPRSLALPNAYVFYLLPTFGDQARALVDFIGSDESRPKERAASRLAVVHAENNLNQDALSGLQAQAKMYPMKIVADKTYKAGGLMAGDVVRGLVETKPDYVFFFGSGDELTAFAREMEKAKLDAGLLSSAVMVGRAAFGLPPRVAARTYLSYPASLPGRDDFSDFISVMLKSEVAVRNFWFQAVAYAAAKVFVEAVKSSSKQLSRTEIIKGLEQMRNYNTGVTSPVTYGPNRRVGASGSYIVKIDLVKKQYAASGNRVVPKPLNQ